MHGIITDTPVYEKNAWTGDAELTAGTASLLFDTERLYRKMFQDMRDAQTAQGELSLLAPEQPELRLRRQARVQARATAAAPRRPGTRSGSCCPGRAGCATATAARSRADLSRDAQYLDEWIPRWTGKDGDAFAQTLTSGLGDWVPPEGVPTINALASSAYYARLAWIARGRRARALARRTTPHDTKRLFADIERDFNARFLGKDGVYREKDGRAVRRRPRRSSRSRSASCRTSCARRSRRGWPTTS